MFPICSRTMTHAARAVVRVGAAVCVGALVGLSAPAAAAPDAHGEPAHGEAHDAHGDAGHGDAHDDGGHGDSHGGHGAVYSADANGNGTADWMDPDAGEHFVLDDIGFHAINLAILLGIFWWAAVPAVRDMVHQRAVVLKDEIGDAQSVRDEASRRHAALTDRLAAIETEISAMRERAEADAARETADIEARAQRAAEGLSETVGRQIRDEAARARQALRAEAVEIAVELAEGILRDQIAEGDQRALASAFLDTVRTAEEGPHA